MANPPPPFRADQVGSLLRSAPLKEARAKREAGQISADALKAIEDAEDKKDHQDAGRNRFTRDNRRRVPPLVVAL